VLLFLSTHKYFPSFLFILINKHNYIILIIGQVSTLAGTTVCISGTIAANTCNSGSADGVGTNAQFYRSRGVAVNPVGTLLYVTDDGNYNIRTIALPSGKEHIHIYVCIFI
jgi:DNA-binding beta-propeller fold protein YncE